MMRKYIVGALFGLLLAIPLTTFGEQISSIVGKQVKGEHPVIVDGKHLSKNAISIDGTTYAPLRAVADAVGYDIAFTNNSVILSSPTKEGDLVDTTSTPTTLAEPSPFTLKDIEFSINRLKSSIEFAKDNIAKFETAGSTDAVEEQKKYLADCEAELAIWESRKEAIVAK